MKIAFITFGGRIIGTGHLFRCLAIADWINYLEFDVEISFHLYDSGFEEQDKALEILHNRSSYESKIQDKNSIGELDFETVVLDMLDAPINIVRLIKKKSKFLVSVDNVASSRRLSDVAINPLYYRINNNKINWDYVGPKFQIISHKFFNKRSIWRNEVKRILIIQGGSDPFGIAPKIAKHLESLAIERSISLHVIVGPASKQSSDLFS